MIGTGLVFTIGFSNNYDGVVLEFAFAGVRPDTKGFIVNEQYFFANEPGKFDRKSY